MALEAGCDQTQPWNITIRRVPGSNNDAAKREYTASVPVFADAFSSAFGGTARVSSPRGSSDSPSVAHNPLDDVKTPLEPRPPCRKEPVPPYPDLDGLAIVKSWSRSDLGRSWRPPDCIGWTKEGFTTLVTILARFRHTQDNVDLLRRIGAISGLAGLRYWSTTHQRWQTLISDSYASTYATDRRQRADFTPDEMKAGSVFYFEQTDNLSGKAVYRMHIVEASSTRLVFGVANATTIRYYLVPIFHPAELQSMYFLDRESEVVWRYYSIVRMGKNSNGLISGNESSSINRAVAFYRYLVGIPAAQEPPQSR